MNRDIFKLFAFTKEHLFKRERPYLERQYYVFIANILKKA